MYVKKQSYFHHICSLKGKKLKLSEVLRLSIDRDSPDFCENNAAMMKMESALTLGHRVAAPSPRPAHCTVVDCSNLFRLAKTILTIPWLFKASEVSFWGSKSPIS